MVYINENSKIVSFPKVSTESFDKIHFVNQVTKFSFDLFTTDTTNNSLVYNIDISPVIDKFEAGQYDYSFQKNDGTVICGGILQFEGFTPTTITYNHTPKFIQYTPDETAYPEANTTITITENDTYNVEDYDTAVVNVQSSSMMVTNVWNTPYERIEKHDDAGEPYDSLDRFEADLLFTLNCDVKTLWKEKDTTYVTLSNYSKKRKKNTVFNDEMQSDPRLKMYCWIVRYDDDPLTWTYFYTTQNYNNSVSEMHQSEKPIYARRLLHPTERCWASYDYENNYATCLNQLATDWTTVNDWWNEDQIERYEKGDIDNYFIGSLSKNPIHKWNMEWWGGDTDDNELIAVEKDDFMDWLMGNCIVQRGYINNDSNPQDIYGYRTYCDDYPIVPIKLADCKVLIYGDLVKEMYGQDYGWQKYVPLKEIPEEYLHLLEKVVLKLPYNTNYLIGRMYTPKGMSDFIYKHWNEVLYPDYFDNANRVGANKRTQNINSGGRGLKTFFKLGICNEKSIKSGNYKDIPQYNFQMLSFVPSERKFDMFQDDERNVVITKVI